MLKAIYTFGQITEKYNFYAYSFRINIIFEKLKVKKYKSGVQISVNFLQKTGGLYLIYSKQGVQAQKVCTVDMILLPTENMYIHISFAFEIVWFGKTYNTTFNSKLFVSMVSPI